MRALSSKTTFLGFGGHYPDSDPQTFMSSFNDDTMMTQKSQKL
jgi:hypothetical protein